MLERLQATFNENNSFLKQQNQTPIPISWNELFGMKSSFKLLYMLQIVDSLIFPLNNNDNDYDHSSRQISERADWCCYFLEQGGFYHLLHILISQDWFHTRNVETSNNNSTNRVQQQACLVLVLKITNFFMETVFSFLSVLHKPNQQISNGAISLQTLEDSHNLLHKDISFGNTSSSISVELGHHHRNADLQKRSDSAKLVGMISELLRNQSRFNPKIIFHLKHIINFHVLLRQLLALVWLSVEKKQPDR